DEEAAANVLAKAAKLQGLMEKDAPYIDPRLFQAMPNLIFTDDLDAIQINRAIEDGESEVVD
ncbi:hypothetical protein NK918_25085, partial [Salmonella enterica subsp. enterica serovar Typhimurium]|uniref:hypothetical protein n=1 Tax=Salmonella enterica TaxID=28901 RepID=UPI0020A2824D